MVQAAGHGPAIYWSPTIFSGPALSVCMPVTLRLVSLAYLAAAPLTAQSVQPRDFTQADVDFVQGMIMHHAQAVTMSDWCATHGARADLQILCKRIALSQRDEIK